jgi:hypothetical protein
MILGNRGIKFAHLLAHIADLLANEHALTLPRSIFGRHFGQPVCERFGFHVLPQSLLLGGPRGPLDLAVPELLALLVGAQLLPWQLARAVPVPRSPREGERLPLRPSRGEFRVAGALQDGRVQPFATSR